MTSKPFGDLVGSIDEGTTSARFVLFKAGTADIVCFYQKEIRTITPNEGWVEQDPMEILDAVNECIEKTVEKLIALGGTSSVSTFSLLINFSIFFLNKTIGKMRKFKNIERNLTDTFSVSTIIPTISQWHIGIISVKPVCSIMNLY